MRKISLFLDDSDLKALDYVRAEFQMAENTEAKQSKRRPEQKGYNETLISTIHITAKVLSAERRLHNTNEKGENKNENE